MALPKLLRDISINDAKGPDKDRILQDIILRINRLHEIVSLVAPSTANGSSDTSDNLQTSAINKVAKGATTYQVSGLGTLRLVEGSNVTLTTTQPSPGVVQVEIASSGGGGGGSMVRIFTADMIRATASATASSAQATGAGGVTVLRRVMASATSADTFIFDDFAPDEWDGTSITVDVSFATSSIAAGTDVRWQVEACGLESGDTIASMAYGTGVTGTEAGVSAQTHYITTVAGVVPSGTNPTARVYYRLTRQQGNPSDADTQLSLWQVRVTYVNAS